jgi:hypothetical protein
MMLPWEVTSGSGGATSGGGPSTTTYNANISRALAALMPKKATNRYQLAGDDMGSALTDAVMHYIEADWKLLDVENKAADALKQLRTQYRVVSAKISPLHQPEYGRWEGGESRETNLHATVQKTSFPPNVSDAVVLLYQDSKTEDSKSTDGKVTGADNFLSAAQWYETLAFSVPWLQDAIRQNPGVPVRISYVHNASFGEKAMTVFAADMHAAGKDDLAAGAKSMQSQICLLITGTNSAESYWLLFPDKHMILWRYTSPSGLLNWKPADFTTKNCSEYKIPTTTGGCVGAVISADGTLVK